MLLIPAIIFLLLVSKWLLLLFGASYSANILMLLWILDLASLFVVVNHVYYSILQVQGRIRELVALCGFITIAVLVGSYLITSTTGIIGVGYAWIAAQVLVSVYVLLAMRSRYQKRQVQGERSNEIGRRLWQLLKAKGSRNEGWKCQMLT